MANWETWLFIIRHQSQTSIKLYLFTERHGFTPHSICKYFSTSQMHQILCRTPLCDWLDRHNTYFLSIISAVFMLHPFLSSGRVSDLSAQTILRLAVVNRGSGVRAPHAHMWRPKAKEHRPNSLSAEGTDWPAVTLAGTNTCSGPGSRTP